MAADDLTQDKLKQFLNYDPETGVFTWRVSYRLPTHTICVGDVAGTRMKLGYIAISVARGRYLAHRLAWLYMTGAWPKHHIDHRDGNPGNNRFLNLRDATVTQNLQNQRDAHSHNKTRLLGSSKDKRSGKWRSRIVVNGKEKHIGLFPTAYDAHRAYVEEKRRLHEFCEI